MRKIKRGEYLTAYGERLLKTLPSDLKTQEISQHRLSCNNGWWIGIGDRSKVCPLEVDLNVILGTLFVLNIQIREDLRGKGFGFQLYQSLEEIAKMCGCNKIRMMPSGQCEGSKKESRKEYLIRKLGYQPYSSGEVIKYLE